MSLLLPLAGLGLSDRFALIVDGLRRAVAARMASNVALGPLLILLWPRLHRLAMRFARLAERPAAARPAPAGMPPRTRANPPRRRLPTGFAWLVRLVPEAASFGSQLQHLLSDPEMAALLAAAPQMKRMLRPLCRMLGTPIPILLAPAKPASVRSEVGPEAPATLEAKAEPPPNLVLVPGLNFALG